MENRFNDDLCDDDDRHWARNRLDSSNTGVCNSKVCHCQDSKRQRAYRREAICNITRRCDGHDDGLHRDDDASQPQLLVAILDKVAVVNSNSEVVGAVAGSCRQSSATGKDHSCSRGSARDTAALFFNYKNIKI